MKKYLPLLALCAALTSCGSTGGGGQGGGGGGGTGQTGPDKWQKVAGVTSQVTGMREVMKATVAGKDVVAVLSWRDYSQKTDGQVSKWYGDMGSPPPKFVVESLIISVDGRGVIVPPSKTRYLASQWMNDSTSLGLYLKNGKPCVYVDLGDGAEAWTASYVVDPASGVLTEHQVEDGPAFHNAADPM